MVSVSRAAPLEVVIVLCHFVFDAAATDRALSTRSRQCAPADHRQCAPRARHATNPQSRPLAETRWHAMNELSTDTVGLLRRELRDTRSLAANIDHRLRTLSER